VGANVVEALCIHNGKMRPVETIPGRGGEGIKENEERGKFNYNILLELL
jgi:hypothetical protein